MAGYMGFGMQSWIYKKNPRKPFAKRERIPSFNSLPKHNKDFTLKYNRKENKKLNGLLTVLIIVVSVFLVSFLYSQFNEYSKEQSQSIVEKMRIENNYAFNFLFNSGYSRLKNSNYLGAYSEFKLAYNLNSENEELNQLLLETLSILCEKDEKYCAELDEFMNKF